MGFRCGPRLLANYLASFRIGLPLGTRLRLRLSPFRIHGPLRRCRLWPFRIRRPLRSCLRPRLRLSSFRRKRRLRRPGLRVFRIPGLNRTRLLLWLSSLRVSRLVRRLAVLRLTRLRLTNALRLRRRLRLWRLAIHDGGGNADAFSRPDRNRFRRRCFPDVWRHSGIRRCRAGLNGLVHCLEVVRLARMCIQILLAGCKRRRCSRGSIPCHNLSLHDLSDRPRGGPASRWRYSEPRRRNLRRYHLRVRNPR